MSKRQYFDTYIQNLLKIRRLSSPSLDGIESAEKYSSNLRDNFVTIGQLAEQNREILGDVLLPLIESEEELSDEDIDDMYCFVQGGMDAMDLENLDPYFIAMVTDRIQKDAGRKNDLSAQIHCNDLNISSIYSLMSMANRITNYPELFRRYQSRGMTLADYFCSLREKDQFERIPDSESRELVLTNARFACVFYEDYCVGGPGQNEREMAMDRASLAVYEDTYYHSMVPDMDWNYYHFRTLVYFAISTDYLNSRGFNDAQLDEICKYTEELWDLWHSDPEIYGEFDPEHYIRNLLIRNRYLAGKMSGDEYIGEMLKLYDLRDKIHYWADDAALNIQIPTEILCYYANIPLTDEIKTILTRIYNDVIVYTLRMPNSGFLTYMFEYLDHFLRYFIEFPGGITFEDMMLNLLAALHPPTYVHTRMVAEFTACLCRHLIDREPELLLGILDCETIEDVRLKRDELIDLAYHCALCHDTGKLFIVDTIFIYGRKLFDEEFGYIKTHPKMGAEYLRRYPSTEAYADVALGHHKWYDNSKGYPEDFDTSTSPLKTIIDLVLCADCLDAATDTVGRSYNRGKTIEAFTEEIREGSGTHYAPWLADLLSDEPVRKDIYHLLKHGREQNYQDTFRLLKDAYVKADLSSAR